MYPKNHKYPLREYKKNADLCRCLINHAAMYINKFPIFSNFQNFQFFPLYV